MGLGGRVGFVDYKSGGEEPAHWSLAYWPNSLNSLIKCVCIFHYNSLNYLIRFMIVLLNSASWGSSREFLSDTTSMGLVELMGDMLSCIHIAFDFVI